MVVVCPLKSEYCSPDHPQGANSVTERSLDAPDASVIFLQIQTGKLFASQSKFVNLSLLRYCSTGLSVRSQKVLMWLIIY